MNLAGNKWCLRTADIAAAQDYTIDGMDGTQFINAFNTGLFDMYMPADLNMDGAVDGTLFNNSFNAGISPYFSIIYIGKRSSL